MQTTRAKEEAPEVANPLSEAAQPVTIPTSDEIVEDQAFYVNLCDEQSEQNVDEFNRVRSINSISAVRGQNWKPAPGDRAEMKMRHQNISPSKFSGLFSSLLSSTLPNCSLTM